jgi:hypothetical protein
MHAGGIQSMLPVFAFPDTFSGYPEKLCAGVISRVNGSAARMQQHG